VYCQRTARVAPALAPNESAYLPLLGQILGQLRKFMFDMFDVLVYPLTHTLYRLAQYGVNVLPVSIYARFR